MKGLNIASIKKHPALIPLYVCISVGASLGVFGVAHAVKSPDVIFNKTGNPEPWEAYRNKQFKHFSPIRDYSQSASQAPKY